MATIDDKGNLVDYQGNTWDYQFKFYQDAAGTIPQDISTWLILYALKAHLEDSDEDALVRAHAQAGSGPDDDPVNGICHLQISSDKTRPVAPNTAAMPYFAILKRVIPQGDDVPPLVETLSIQPMVVLSQGLQSDEPEA